MGLEVVVAASVVLSVLILSSLWLRLPSWTVVDLFLLGIALYFGLYTIVDAMSAEPANVDGLIAFTVFLVIGMGALVLWLAARFGAFRETSLARLQVDWRACPATPIVAVIGVAIAYRWYTAAYFGEFGELGETELAAIERELPYWYTSIGMIVSTTILGVGLCACGKVGISSGWRRLFWLAMTASAGLFVLGMGRRMAMTMLIVVGWTILAGQRGKRSSWVTVSIIALAMPVLVALSNVYQAYRAGSYRGVPLENVIAADDVGSLLAEAAAVERTVSNLQQRQAMWRFNYEVMHANLVAEASIQWGAIALGDFPNYVPSAFNPGKEWLDSEEDLLRRFGLELYDRPSNLFSYTYADFGFAAAVIAPAMMLALAWLCAVVLRRLRDPFLRVVLMGVALVYALNIETGYLVPLGLARDFIIVALLYVVARGAWRTSKALLHASIVQRTDHDATS